MSLRDQLAADLQGAEDLTQVDQLGYIFESANNLQRRSMGGLEYVD